PGARPAAPPPAARPPGATLGRRTALAYRGAEGQGGGPRRSARRDTGPDARDPPAAAPPSPVGVCRPRRRRAVRSESRQTPLGRRPGARRRPPRDLTTRIPVDVTVRPAPSGQNAIAPKTVCDAGCGAGGVLRRVQEGRGDECMRRGYDVSPPGDRRVLRSYSWASWAPRRPLRFSDTGRPGGASPPATSARPPR